MTRIGRYQAKEDAMAWTGWTLRGGPLDGGIPSVGRNADGRLEVFSDGEGQNGTELWHIWQTAPMGGWSAWESLGTPPAEFMGFVAASANADGRLEVFARIGLMSSGTIWHIWQTAPNGGWSAWDNLGAPSYGLPAHFLSVGRNADGRLEVFVVNDAGLSHIWQTAPNGGWSAWDNLGKPGSTQVISLAVEQNADGRLEAFCGALDGALWHIWQTAPNNGWSGWASLGAAAGANLTSPAVARDANGRLAVFAIGGQHTLWHIHQNPTSPTDWSGWISLGAPAGVTSLDVPVAALNGDGRVDVYALEINGALWHIRQDPTAANGWSGWTSLSGEPNNGAGVGHAQNGSLALFVEGRVVNGVHPLWER
jgi:hypothetical protein